MRPVIKQRRSTRHLGFETYEPRRVLAAWNQPVDFVGPQPWPPLEQPTGAAAFASSATESSTNTTSPVASARSDGNHSPLTSSSAGRPGAGQTVAIIDSGIAYDHEAFANQFGGGFGGDNRVVGGWDFAEGDADPYDDGPAGFHGTHVAGIAAGDSSQLTGVAPGADIVALRIYTDWGETRVEWLEDSLRWVIDHRTSFRNPITAVNLSVGAASAIDDWSRIEDELRTLRGVGVFVAVSAGNAFSAGQSSDVLSYPASSESVIPVASVDANGQLSSFSQRSPRVLAAPGRLIRSAVPDYVLGADGHDDDYSAATGTSMAAPFVAAASMVVRQAWLDAGRPSPTVDDLEHVLRDSADSVVDAATGMRFARVNLPRALASLEPVDVSATTTAPTSAQNVPPAIVTPSVVTQVKEASKPSPRQEYDDGNKSEFADACVVPMPRAVPQLIEPATSNWSLYSVEPAEPHRDGAAASPSNALDAPVRAIDFLFRKLGRA